MQNKRWLKTLRSLGLFLLCTAGIGLLRASDAPDSIESLPLFKQEAQDRTYLYYFESSEAPLSSTTPSALFAFGTLPKEKVTLVAYGLDNIIEPQLTLTEEDGTVIAVGQPTGNPYVAMFQFEATEQRRYDFHVTRKNTDAEASGLIRVMVFQGDPINRDVTYLDSVNPLLPGRSFMVAGRPATESEGGLRMSVEALAVSRFDDARPDLFASRGSDEQMPTEEERLVASPDFDWVNVEAPGIEFYTVTVRATPETLRGVDKLEFKQLNANTFFYYNFYLIIGAGSDPVSVVRGDECQTDPNRIECIRASGGNESGRTVEPPPLAVSTAEPEKEEVVGTPTAPTGNEIPEQPPIRNSACGVFNEPGEYIFFFDRNHTAPDRSDPTADAPYMIYTFDDGVYFESLWFIPAPPVVDINQPAGPTDPRQVSGTNCNDIITDLGGNDSIAGGPGDDLIAAGPGNDEIFPGEDNDIAIGEAGNDNFWIYLDNSNDIFAGGDGNDTLNYEIGIGYVTPRNVNIIINGDGDGDGVYDGVDTATDGLSWTDSWAEIENIRTGDGNDRFTISNPVGYTEFLTNGGNDLININLIGGTLPTIRTGDDNDTFNINSAITNNVTLFGEAGNDTFNVAVASSSATLNAGDGITDTINYNTTDAVIFNVVAQTAVVNGVTQNIQNFENFIGSTQDDTFNVTADATVNLFHGQGGVDTATITSGTGLTVDVTSQLVQTMTIQAGTGAIDTYRNIENLNLSNSADTVTIHETFAGLDSVTNIYDGNGGTDTATYALSAIDPAATDRNDLNVTVNGTTVTVANMDATWTDTFIEFEEIVTGAGNDTWVMQTAPAADQTFDAGAGYDTADYSTAGGGLVFDYTTASTTVTSGANTHTLLNFEQVIAGSGDDSWLIAGAGTTNRTFNGGGHVLGDSVSYADPGADLNYTANLTAATNTIVDDDPAAPDPDTLINIEILTTDNGTDVIAINDSNIVTLNTLGGNDTINARFDTRANTFDMGSGTDTLNYTGSASPLIVNYTGGSGTVTDNPVVTTDNFVGVENITGGSGDDTFNVNTDASNNIFDGGIGTDTFDYTGGTAVTYTIKAGEDTATYTSGGNLYTDTLRNFENFNGSAGTDTYNFQDIAGLGTLNSGGAVDTANFGTIGTALTVNYAGCPSNTVSAVVSTGGNSVSLSNFETFVGGTATDTFNVTWSDCNLTFNGGGTVDADVIDYVSSTVGLNFTLDGTDTVDAGGGSTHNLISFAVVRGTNQDDTFDVFTNTYTTIDANGGADTITVNNAAFTTDIIVNGDLGVDEYISNATDPLTVSLTAAVDSVTTNNATPHTHTLQNMEELTLNTEAGDNSTVGINNTNNITDVTTGAGNETVTVTNGGTVESLTTGGGTDIVNVTTANSLDDIDLGGGDDTINLLTQDTTSTITDGGANTDTFSITTTSATTVTQTGASIAVLQDVVDPDITDTFNNFEVGTFNTGVGDDIFTIDTSVAGNWTLNSGDGANRYRFIGNGSGNVTVTINSSAAGVDADDILDFSQMTTGVTVNAGQVGTQQSVTATFRLFLNEAITKVEGSDSADTIIGTGVGDEINGNNGGDTIHGMEGNDIINGNEGIDIIYGGVGSDVLHGNEDGDWVFGGSDSPATTCTAGDDAGDDQVYGDEGADRVYGGNENTGIVGAGCQDLGNDIVDGGLGDDVSVYGGNRNGSGVTGGNDGSDQVTGGDGNDAAVYGGNNNCQEANSATGTDAGDTMVTGGNGNDTVYGGNNNNCVGTANENNTDGGDTIVDQSGADTIYGGNNNSSAAAGTGNDDGTDNINTVDPVPDNANDDTVVGGNRGGNSKGTDSATDVITVDPAGPGDDTVVTDNAP